MRTATVNNSRFLLLLQYCLINTATAECCVRPPLRFSWASLPQLNAAAHHASSIPQNCSGRLLWIWAEICTVDVEDSDLYMSDYMTEGS